MPTFVFFFVNLFPSPEWILFNFNQNPCLSHLLVIAGEHHDRAYHALVNKTHCKFSHIVTKRKQVREIRGLLNDFRRARRWPKYFKEF